MPYYQLAFVITTIRLVSTPMSQFGRTSTPTNPLLSGALAPYDAFHIVGLVLYCF